MSSPNSPTLTLDVSSRRAERWLAPVALAGAMAGVGLLNALDVFSACALGAICGGTLAAGMHRAGWTQSPQRLVALTWRSDGRWLLADATGVALSGELCSDTRIGRAAVWLSWRTARQRRVRMLLTAIDLPADDLRRLVVRLRIQAAERAGPDIARA